jgi:hypothetical protein
MRTFSKPLLRIALCGLLAFSIFLPSVHAKDKAKDLPPPATAPQTVARVAAP